MITLMGFYTSVAMTLAFYDVPAGAPGMGAESRHNRHGALRNDEAIARAKRTPAGATTRRRSQPQEKAPSSSKPRGDHSLADASLDWRRQNAYKSMHKGEALRTRGAPQTPDTRAARRCASVRGTQHSARRDYHAVL